MTTGIGIKFDRVREIDIKTVGKIKKDAELVAESIHRIINTKPYERPRETVGSRIKEVIFEPNDYITGTLGSYYIANAIEKFEPRVDISQIITRVGDTANTLVIRVIFKLKDNPGETLATNIQVQL